jgi:WD40 repeat protein
MIWTGCLAAILLIAGLEALLLWQRGYTYNSKTSVLRTWVVDLSMDQQGELAAGLVTFMQNANNGSWNDIVLIDLKQRVTKSLELRDLQPECVALAPGADSLAVASKDGCIYSLSGGPEIFSRNERPESRLIGRLGNDQIMRLAFSPDARFLGAIGARFVWLWDWPSGTLLRKVTHNAVARGSIAFSPDSRTIMWPHSSGLCLSEVGSSVQAQKVDLGNMPVARAFPDFVSHLAAVASYDEVSVHRFDGDTLWQESFLSPVVALDPRQQILAIASNETDGNTINIRHLVTGQQLARLDSRVELVAGLAFSADGVLYVWDYQGGVHAWNTDQGKKLWSMSVPAQSSPYNRRMSAEPSQPLSRRALASGSQQLSPAPAGS